MSKNNNFERLIKDKIFQFYFNKIYNDNNYNNFIKFTYEQKSIFLCELFLFFNSSKINKKTSVINEEQNFKLKNDFQKILNKYSLPLYSNDFFVNNNNINNIENELNNNKINSNQTINTNINKNISRNDEFNYKNTLNNKIYSYSKLNFDFDSSSKNLISNFNTFKENNYENDFFESKQTFNFPIFKSKKNDIDDTDKLFEPLKDINNFHNINHPSIKNKNFYFLNYKSTNNKTDDLSKKYISNNTNNTIFNNKIFSKRKFYSDNNESKFCYSTTNRQFNYNNKNKVLINDIILVNQSITQDSKIPLREFNKEDLVERLFKCPDEKYITLSSNEAKKVANVIIEYMRKEKDYQNIIEENNKKNKENLVKINEYIQKNNELEDKINKLKNNYDIKKKLMQKYIDGLTEKIDNTKEEFEEYNNNYLLTDEKLKNDILNDINIKLENLNNN